MKGIVLAGGKGSRLMPITKVLNKQLLPVYDKPMIYYPISTLISAGIREILIISNPESLPLYKKLFGDGSKFGCDFSYVEQVKPNGLSEAFILGENFIKNDSVTLILGDNIFYSDNFLYTLKESIENNSGGTIFGYRVSNPSDYGIVNIDKKNNIKSLEEKPQNPNSNIAIPGIYIYDNSVINKAKLVKPSQRGELEITDLNNLYLDKKNLKLIMLPDETIWFDTGTCKFYAHASELVRVIQERKNIIVGSIEEAAFKSGFIDKGQLLDLSIECIQSEYGQYLNKLAKND